MNKLKSQVLTGKSIRLLGNNQYTFEVDTESTKTEIKNWIEKFFAIKVKNINSYRLPGKKRNRKSLEFSFCRKRMIVTLDKNYFIPLFLNE
uniref:ribosomal protein L23 n=1 Tax=Anemia phyllitidis TaxID=12940 RepID=UPI0021AC9061|nr:ribosomal protein L23 [Anemia phyllitidis]UUL71116.1 ribosomal protein L23 [Anemia phyllitidis]